VLSEESGISILSRSIDGPDFLILRSLEEVFEECRVLGVGIETSIA
jgi:hypothetical protein